MVSVNPPKIERFKFILEEEVELLISGLKKSDSQFFKTTVNAIKADSFALNLKSGFIKLVSTKFSGGEKLELLHSLDDRLEKSLIVKDIANSELDPTNHVADELLDNNFVPESIAHQSQGSYIPLVGEDEPRFFKLRIFTGAEEIKNNIDVLKEHNARNQSRLRDSVALRSLKKLLLKSGKRNVFPAIGVRLPNGKSSLLDGSRRAEALIQLDGTLAVLETDKDLSPEQIAFLKRCFASTKEHTFYETCQDLALSYKDLYGSLETAGEKLEISKSEAGRYISYGRVNESIVACFPEEEKLDSAFFRNHLMTLLELTKLPQSSISELSIVTALGQYGERWLETEELPTDAHMQMTKAVYKQLSATLTEKPPKPPTSYLYGSRTSSKSVTHVKKKDMLSLKVKGLSSEEEEELIDFLKKFNS